MYTVEKTTHDKQRPAGSSQLTCLQGAAAELVLQMDEQQTVAVQKSPAREEKHKIAQRHNPSPFSHDSLSQIPAGCV